MSPQAQAIRILQVEDSLTDSELSLFHLKKAGLDCTAQRVDTESALRAALRDFRPDLVLSDFSLPQFNGLAALDVVRETAPELPFIFLSGTIGEEQAVAALHRGAVDYVLKGNLTRLPSAVRRALSDAQAMRERRVERERLARLDRVLRMLSGVNALMVRVRDRRELLSETSRLAVAVGGYAAAIIYAKAFPSGVLEAQACNGSARERTETLRDALLAAEESQPQLLEQVIRTNKEFTCSDVQALTGQQPLVATLNAAGIRSLTILPLVADGAAIGALALVAEEAGAAGPEELQMLREVSGNLSFALQFLQKDTKVRFLSYYDSQTGLPKRSLFCDRLNKVMAQPGGRTARCAVALFDIVGLSLINDSFSRRLGDLLLQQVAERLKQRLPHGEHLGHFGGGTFAIIIDRAGQTPDEARLVAREHGAAIFGEPFHIADRTIPVGVRSGLAVCPDHGKDAATLVQNAEAALHVARASSDRQAQYSPQQQTQMLERLGIEQRLRLALRQNQFELHYQPKVNVVSRRIEGVEALIRWRDPQSGLVSPGIFLPVLESTGLMADVGAWVVERAALDCQHWLNAGLAPIRIAVNISPSQLKLPEFVETFMSAVDSCSKAGAGLDIEITEGMLHEELAAEVAKLKMLRTNGVKIAIDDFGTGYSSLSRLARLPIDTLKIDQTFIRGIPEDYAGRMLAKTIVSLAHTFRLTTVAEGVETQEQLNFLWQAGCDQSQGFLHSPALPSSELMSLLANGRGQFLLPREVEPATQQR
jgi:diguanylate cyclase (GGDEF)-like protein